MLAVIVGGYISYANQTPDWTPPQVTLPIPNGYDDYVAAGQLLPKTSNRFNAATGTGPELKAHLAASREALTRLRKASAKDCRAPASLSFSQGFPELATFRELGRTLAGEGNLAVSEGRHRSAARSYGDGLRLGGDVQRGGVLIQGLVGLAIQAISLKSIQDHTDQLDATSAFWLCREMGRLEPRRGTAGESFAGERDGTSAALMEMFRSKASFQALGQQAGGAGGAAVAGGMLYLITPKRVILQNQRTYMDQLIAAADAPFHQHAPMPPVPRDPINSLLMPVFSQAQFSYHRRDAMWRLTQLRLALRTYELEHGRPPASLQALVPRYLAAIPEDPFAPAPMVYRVVKGKPVVYSVGPDGQDNGGEDLGNRVTTDSRGDVVTMKPSKELGVK